MSDRYCLILFGALAVSAGSTASANDRVPADALPPAYVVHAVTAAGHDLRTIEFKNGVYVVDVAVKGGRMYRATVDPKQGRLHPRPSLGHDLPHDPSPAGQSASIAVQLAASAGYPDFIDLKVSGDTYEMTGLDGEGREVKLSIDPGTGAVRPLSMNK